MKKVFLFTMLFVACFYAQQVIPVEAGANTISSALSTAQNGDIIELVTSGGIYTVSSSAIDITKKITIRAQSSLAEKPILRSTSTSSTHQIFQIKEGGSLTLQGVILDGEYPQSATAAKYCFRTYTSGNIVCNIKFYDCEFRNVLENAIKIYSTSVVDTLIISNCIFTNTGKEAILLREGTDKYPTINYVEITNTTFYNIGRGALYAQLVNPAAAVIKINHCTFDNLSTAGDYNLINPVTINNVEIKNSIFSNQGGNDTTSIILYGNSIIKYCDLWNVKKVTLIDSAAIGEGMLNVDPQYEDAANGNFTLKSTSMLLGKADDNKAIGDLRWEPIISPPTSGIHITRLDADGPGDTYELIDRVFGPGASGEVPDLYPQCNHGGVRHIREDWDSTLNKYVFLFDIHVENGIIDYDRCSNFDRQRNEIKTVAPETITGQPGETHIYKWKFKMDSLFQPSPNFCHLHQIKATGGGDDGAPLITITPRKYSDPNQPEWLQLIFTPSTGGSGGGTLAHVELEPLKGMWLDVTEKVIYSDEGKYELTIKKLDGTVVMHYANYLLDMYRAGANFHRGKWGIYRSLNSMSYLRDETVAFADFEIIEGENNTTPSAPTNLVATSVSDRQINLTWNDNSNNETNFLIQRSEDGTNWVSVAAVQANISSYEDKGLTKGTKYYYRVRAENWNAYSDFTNVAEATTQGANISLSAAWNNIDIGITSPAGSASDTAGVFILEGSGKDVYGTSDQFHYVYNVLSGDGIITARVDSIENTHEWAKAGVMIRETLEPNSPHAMAIVTPVATHTNGQGGIAFQYRTTKGGSSSSIDGGFYTAPYWVRISRKDSILIGYRSSDGITWDSIGTVIIKMPTTVHAGLMLTSHNSAVLSRAVFSNVSIATDTTGDPHIWLEAESAKLTSPMVVKEDYTASGGKYILTESGKNTSSAPTDGHAIYNFNVKTAGMYKIWIRVKAPTKDDDSFWFKLDDNAWFPMNEIQESSEEWIWDEVHNSNMAKQIVTYNLNEGLHTFTVAYREDGTLLDKILITRDTTFNPNGQVTSIKEDKEIAKPAEFVLYNNYPNPFNPSTKIRYALPIDSDVKLTIYDIMGREVVRLVDGTQNAGTYEVTWNSKDTSGRQLVSGVYFARLQAGNYSKIIKLILMK